MKVGAGVQNVAFSLILLILVLVGKGGGIHLKTRLLSYIWQMERKKIDLPKLVDALSLNAVASEGVKNLSEKYRRSVKIADLAQSSVSQFLVVTENFEFLAHFLAVIL